MDLETKAKPRFLNHEDLRAWFLIKGCNPPATRVTFYTQV